LTEPQNRDIPCLQRVVSAMQDVCDGESRISWLSDRMFFITQRFSKTAGCGGQPCGFDAMLADLDEKAERYRRQVKDCMRELGRAERILNGIRDANMRTFVKMVYVLGLPTSQVRSELNLTEWKFKELRRAVEQAKDMSSVRWPGNWAEE